MFQIKLNKSYNLNDFYILRGCNNFFKNNYID